MPIERREHSKLVKHNQGNKMCEKCATKRTGFLGIVGKRIDCTCACTGDTVQTRIEQMYSPGNPNFNKPGVPQTRTNSNIISNA